MNWIQAHLRCGLLDTMLPWVTHLCDHGEIWILLAAMLLAFPKTRRAGACVACALMLDLLLCNIWLKPMIGRIRPFAVNPAVSLLIAPPTDASFPSGAYGGVLCRHAGTEPGGKQPLEARAGAGASHRLLPVVPLRSLAHRCTGGAAVGALAGWLGARLVQFLSEKYRTRRL